MSNLVIMIVKAFLIIFVHLQAIERHLQMHRTADILQDHIDEYRAIYDTFQRGE